jgi:hypothetical protein
MRPYLEKPFTQTQKSSGGVARGVDPEFKPQYCKKKKKQNKTKNSRYRSNNIKESLSMLAISLLLKVVKTKLKEGCNQSRINNFYNSRKLENYLEV